MTQLDNLNIKAQEVLITPDKLKTQLPLPEPLQLQIQAARDNIRDILNRDDSRLLVVVGPCSIHDVDAALDYAARLADLASELNDSLLIVMRAYFEKPRTTVGWKGLINDPQMDGSYDINLGLRTARSLLHDLLKIGRHV